jgi:Fe-S cluster assembly protein SufB
MSTVQAELAELAGREYAYGFSTELDTDFAPRGLSEDVIRLISAKRGEPDWLLGLF